MKLWVNDDHDSTTAQLIFRVIPTVTAVGQLVQLVDNAELGMRNKQPLFANLLAATSAFARGNMTSDLNCPLSRNKVRAMRLVRSFLPHA